MGFEKLYYYTFKDINDKKYTVEIWKDIPDGGDIPIPLEVVGGYDPFIIEYPNINNKFEPVRGSGCRFNLISTSDRMFIDLYTADMQEYIIKLYEEIWITPIYSQDILIWCGYLDSEFYEEDFSQINNYIVSFTGNDGLALLDRLNYVSSSDGTKYNAVGSLWDILFNILFKIDLPYTILNIGLSTTSPEISLGEGENILQHIYVNPNNWYNEDDEPETCRKVLEEILKPFGAFLFIDNNEIFITDYNFILSGGTYQTYQKYNVTTFEYEGDNNILVNIGSILDDLYIASDTQKYKVISGINKQVIKYNKYRKNELFSYECSDFFESGGTYVNDLYENYSFVDNYYNSGNTFYSFNDGKFSKVVGTGLLNSDGKSDFNGMKIIPDGVFGTGSTSLNFELKYKLPYFIKSDNYSLKVDMAVYPRSHSYLGYSPAELATSLSIREVRLYCDFIFNDTTIDNNIGKKYIYNLPEIYTFHNATEYWVDSDSSECNKLRFLEPSLDGFWLDNQTWTQLNQRDVFLSKYKLSTYSTDGVLAKSNYTIPLNFDSNSGYLTIKIYDWQFLMKDMDTIESPGTTYPWDLFIKSIKLSIVDNEGNEIEQLDTEYFGDSTNSPLSSKFKDAGEEITNYLGTNVENYPVENGNLLKLSKSGTTEYYEPIQNFIRENKTDILENLLLRSIISNYQNKLIQLNVKLKKLSQLNGFVTYSSTYIPDKKFVINGVTRNLEDATDEVTLIEVSKDVVDIVKVYE